MLPTDEVRGHILIGDNIEELYSELHEALKPRRVVGFIREDFLIEDAKAAVAEAYISEDETKYVILGAKSFNTVSQNALLKVLEEPPRNIEFILIAPSKSIFLPTIRSRMPLVKRQAPKAIDEVTLRLGGLDLGSLYDFVKEHDRLNKHALKSLIEALFHKATAEEGLALTQPQLEAFDKAYRLIELNARAQNVLIMLLMSFLPETRREA